MVYSYFRVAYYLQSLLRHTHWSKRALFDYQNKQLRAIIKYAYNNVPFYYEKFSKVGLKPEDIRSIEDLKKLPIIRREDLQRNSDRLISREFDAAALSVVSTSGSMGRPLFTSLTKKEEAMRHAKLLRPHIICGQKPFDKWVLLSPPQHVKKLNTLQKMFRLYAPSFVSLFEPVDKQLHQIKTFKPDVLDGYPSSLFLLAQKVEEEGTFDIKPKFTIGGAELLDAPTRSCIEKSFGAPYYDQYACEELQMIAWQCRVKGGYHVDADSVVVEFVDECGEAVADGESGEIVCTSLFNYAMPFIRYALDDVGVPCRDDECECGITFPMMKVVEGRKDSFVKLPNGRRVPALVFGWIMEFYKFYSSIYQYKIIQDNVNSLKFLIKKKPSVYDDHTMIIELSTHVRKMLGVSESELAIDVSFVDSIPIDASGKLRKVISKL